MCAQVREHQLVSTRVDGWAHVSRVGECACTCVHSVPGVCGCTFVSLCVQMCIPASAHT